jgi:hypothetical protein
MAVGKLAGAAGGEDIVCPATILASTAVTTAEGWEPLGGAAEYQLDTTQLYVGPPSDDRPLTPEASNGEDQRWRLSDNKNGETWVGCIYRDTSVVLARKLDTRLTQCVARRETVERQGKGTDSHTVEAQSTISCN